MRWLKRDIWKVGIIIIGILLFLLLLVGIPLSTVSAQGSIGGAATKTPTTAQATPTEDATVTALQKEQLTQQVRQLDNWWLYWLYNGSTAFIAAFATVIVALFGIYQWAGNRKKDLGAQAEERFMSAVTGLGDEREGTKIGAAILLRSFLNKEDKENYGRYHAQIFDLAVAYLRLPRTPQPPADPDIPLPLTTLCQALVVVFKEAFPLARKPLEPSLIQSIDTLLKEEPMGELPGLPSLNAAYIQLDNADLRKADLRQVWMPQASLRGANLNEAKLTRANLRGADLRGADLTRADLTKADFRGADLRGANLGGAKLSRADLTGANLCDAKLTQADLTQADLREANLCNAKLIQADLGAVKFNIKNVLGATLSEANLRDADLSFANLSMADLWRANLSAANLRYANLRGTRFTEADLSNADLTEAHLSWADPDNSGLTLEYFLTKTGINTDDTEERLTSAASLKNTILHRIDGLTKEELQSYKAKGAIIDEDSTASPARSTVSPPAPSQSTNVQAPSSTPVQVNTPPPNTDESSSTSSQPSAQP